MMWKLVHYQMEYYIRNDIEPTESQIKEWISMLNKQLPTVTTAIRWANKHKGHDKIGAIKALRAVTGWGLKEAKQAVESERFNLDVALAKFLIEEQTFNILDENLALKPGSGILFEYVQ